MAGIYKNPCLASPIQQRINEGVLGFVCLATNKISPMPGYKEKIF